MCKTDTARPSAALIYSNVAKSYTEQANIDKLRQKSTFERRSKALETALELQSKVIRPARPDCIKGVKMAFCERGDTFVKPTFCNFEHCQWCGQNGSSAHQRRINRMMPGVEKWDALSYLVVTIPYEIRGFYASKKALNKFRTFVRRKLKKDGFDTAAMRWHWAGDCPDCKHKKKESKDKCVTCFGTGCGSSWHPHLNILLPAGNRGKVTAYNPKSFELKKEYLNGWRQSLATWFHKEHKHIKEFEKHQFKTNIYHNYVPAVGSMYYSKKAKQLVKMDAVTYMRRVKHKVNYITRATLRHPDMEFYTVTLKGYNNMSHIGVWEKSKPEPMACPCCGGELKWYADTVEKWHELRKNLVEIAPGMYFLNFLSMEDPPS